MDFLDFLTEKNSVIYYEKKLEDIEENVRLKQSEASLAGEVCGNLSGLFPKRNNLKVVSVSF